jgi:hypothetical protein
MHLLTIMLGLLLGATAAAYFAMRPPLTGLPFPNLNGDFTVRPTVPRIAGYLAGRWAGSCVVGVLAGWLGQVGFAGGLERLPWSINILLAFFLFLVLATGSSPELRWAHWADSTRLPLPVIGLGFLSAGTLLTPFWIAFFLAVLTRSPWAGVLLFTNVFFGHALIALPVLLNVPWTRSRFFQSLLRVIILVCAIGVLLFCIRGIIRT